MRIKLQPLQQQNPAASLNVMVQKATNTLCSREQEMEVKAQERERRRAMARLDAGCPAGKSFDNPKSLKEK